MEKTVKILAISGSLRQKSSNTALMKAIIALSQKTWNLPSMAGWVTFRILTLISMSTMGLFLLGI
ncbi:hypothetical protein BN000_00679 [Neobacillus massiliamazoniensis]|uniref:Uncharacterized protein n=1 Tax=Neobacillus massiliamazoniensis TaxID=1499688 RepID=A0A0U1NRW1_9BACI|nr:hypothetical protein BN000_00679 [Neobacillus massiliamazoniensis]